MEDIFKKDLSGAMVSPDEPGYDKLIGAIFDTMKTAYELNQGYHTPERGARIHGTHHRKEARPVSNGAAAVLRRLWQEHHIRQELLDTARLHVLRPRRNNHRQRVFIAPKVNLITINHDPNPDNRSATYGRPIVIEDKVWIGIGATVLPGVTIGYGSIIGANSVVTHDVPPMTVVGGNPARFIKKIEVK